MGNFNHKHDKIKRLFSQIFERAAFLALEINLCHLKRTITRLCSFHLPSCFKWIRTSYYEYLNPI